MSGLDDLLGRLEDLLRRVEDLDDESKELAFELLDGVDTLHRMALHRLADQLGDSAVQDLAGGDPAVAWLFEAYGIGIDERAVADAAIDTVRSYIHSHGGEVTVLSAHDGVVRLRMSGACSGCTASAQTLRTSIDGALQDHLPGFLRTELEEDDAAPHPPPVGPVPVKLRERPAS
ncbi:MAG: NifU family protein [Acidimicrobiales bacterium]